MSTLYIRNLNERPSRNTVRAALAQLFPNALAITAHKNLRMKGQAFVAFGSADDAAAALAAHQGHQLLGHPMEIHQARTESDAVHVQQGREAAVAARRVAKTEREARRLELSRKRKLGQISSIPTFKKHKGDVVENPPHTTLLLSNVEALAETVSLWYASYPSFVEVRMVAIRKLAFVVFERLEDAVAAHDTVHEEVTVTYAKA